jgi:HMG (high mobility group) box
LTFGELGTRLGELWKSLTDEEKAPYHEQSAADKVRVAALKAEMEKSGSDAASKGYKPEKPKKLDIHAKLKAARKSIVTGKRARDEDSNERDADAGEDAGQSQVSKKARKAASEAAAAEEKAQKAAAKRKAAENKRVRELLEVCWLIAHLWLLWHPALHTC